MNPTTPCQRSKSLTADRRLPPQADNRRVTVGHYENFPVASWLCPPALRPPIVAIYHFARTADDLADEGNASAAERLRMLAAYRADLQAVERGLPPSDRWPQVFGPLADSMRQFRLPPPLLHDLLDAFSQDVGSPSYADRGQLLDYCRRSANPVGRLLLHLYGVGDTVSLRRSDAICSALQLINFWQDLGQDLKRGRCYVPSEDRQAFAVSPEDLAGRQDSPRTRALVASLCGWARGLMAEGAPLVHRLPDRTGWELRFVVQGGLRVLERIERMDHATLAHRPVLTGWDLPAIAWRASRMRPER